MLTLSEKKIWFKKIKKSSIREKDELIIQFSKNQKVLDIGCIGQDRSYQSEIWLHNKLRKVAREITGVDIDHDAIDHLKRKGYNVIHVSELENDHADYDVIVMADVIEHVNNPVEFIKSYSKYLKKEGILLISTPNATRIRTFFEIIFTTTYSINYEHTCWFCPKTLLEVINRADIMPVEFYWLKEYNPKLKYSIYAPLLKVWRNFNSNFLFVCKNEKKG